MVLLLKPLGFDSIGTDSVAEGKALLAAETFDLVVTDFNLPDGTALDIIEEVRRLGLTAKVLCVSGGGDSGYNATAVRSRGVSFLQKPFLVPKFKETIEALCKR